MKITPIERNKIIFDMWENKRMSFMEIAESNIPSFLSIQRIRNIIYAGPSRLKNSREKSIYSVFRLKFLELKEVNAAIWFTYENQPHHSISERTVRRIIDKELENKKYQVKIK